MLDTIRKTVAQCHLSNYECVYIDIYNKPIEVEEVNYWLEQERMEA